MMDWQDNPQDYKVTSAARREGGQHVGLPRCKVRVEHIPTGIAAECEARSQHRSRKICMEMIEWALAEI